VCGPPERFLATRNSAEIRRLLNACLRQRACAIIHGAPAEEKTFTVKCLVAEQQAAGRDDLLYVYAPANPSPLGILQRICAAAGTAVRSNLKFALTQSLIENFRQRPRLPVIVVDEAQHLLRRPFDALESIRELRDLTADDLAARRQDSYGCGLLLLGSHELYEQFERNKFLLGQWRDRIQHKAQLTGMDQGEVLEIAARELGNCRPARLGEELRQEILSYARELDPDTLVCAKCARPLGDRDAQEPCPCGGRFKPCVFYSPRKLSIWIDRAREKRARKGAAA
jgi:DNA transposition AAA+ family ATPase